MSNPVIRSDDNYTVTSGSNYIFFYIDVDECVEISDICGPNSICNNTVGSHNCSCTSGYNVTDTNLPINNIYECLDSPSVCWPNSHCYNENGSYLYIDECLFSPSVCGPDSNCTNEIGSYNCSCLDGFTATNSSLLISINNTCRGTGAIWTCKFRRCSDVVFQDIHQVFVLKTLLCAGFISCISSNTSVANSKTGKIFVKIVFTKHDFHFQGFLNTVNILVSELAFGSWENLNNNSRTDNTSTALLRAIENITARLTDGNFTINETSLELNRTVTTSTSYSGISNLPNSTTEIEIPQIPISTPITIIVFTTLDKILPTRNTTTSSSNNSSKSDVRINGDVVVVKIDNKTINNISFAFDITDQSLGNSQCVFWNFNLDAWDSTGCEVKPYISKGNETGKITCECNHTTSFSILMSPFSIKNIALAYITYIGVAISMASLILCLIIEIIVWKSMTRNDTSYMRHVSIVNIAVSLLIANICFIIGAAIAEQEQPTSVGRCSPAVFFMHFFYLALFFWMLMSALLLFYRTVMVLSQMSRAKMMAIAFIVSYGAPLLIAVITVASTAGPQNYISKRNACWLNWNESKALLAFVIPALTIVAINLVVLIVVLYKMLRRGVGAATQPDEKHALVVIARCVAILTPIFGLTWGFGIGTMVSQDLGIHGFFILVFGTLLDSKV
uniref:Adhesion G protein-coupled receptor F5-like n=1 Tax=Sinocyclocheilus anshuiensis TaxID=1608454 RepID=A0A671QV57_9TELE